MDPYQPSNLESFQLQQQELPHAGFGVASFILACISLVGMFAAFAAAGYLATSNLELVPQSAGIMMAVGLAIIGFGLLLVISAVLAIVGLMQSNRKKVFAILALAISGLAIAAVVALMTIGIVVGQSQAQKMKQVKELNRIQMK